MKNKILQLARGVRDFGPAEKIAKNKIIKKLQSSFESFGYNPIDTPMLERYELFASKFGIGELSEAMKETFRLKDQGERELVLRTELTLPFARFIGMNPEIKKPFRRYQMGTVFRDGPIKLGRYREFWQCDVDVVGLAGEEIDSELLLLAEDVFNNLELEVEILLNNRLFLDGLLTKAGFEQEDFESIIVSVDKIEKIGREGVLKELTTKGFSLDKVAVLLDWLSWEGQNQDLFNKFSELLGDNLGLIKIQKTWELTGKSSRIRFSPSLARGLAYYTGNVFEIFLSDQTVIKSSLGGGGRYDNMIGGLIGSKEIVPAIGLSFGLETIFDAFQLKNKDSYRKTVVDILVAPFVVDYLPKAREIAKQLRDFNYNVEISYLYKPKKFLEYANNYQIKKVILLGEDEIIKNLITIKDLETGEQKTASLKSLFSSKKSA